MGKVVEHKEEGLTAPGQPVVPQGCLSGSVSKHLCDSVLCWGLGLREDGHKPALSSRGSQSSWQDMPLNKFHNKNSTNNTILFTSIIVDVWHLLYIIFSQISFK